MRFIQSKSCPTKTGPAGETRPTRMNHNMLCCVPIKITFQTQTIRFDQISSLGPQQINHNFATGAGGRGAAAARGGEGEMHLFLHQHRAFSSNPRIQCYKITHYL